MKKLVSIAIEIKHSFLTRNYMHKIRISRYIIQMNTKFLNNYKGENALLLSASERLKKERLYTVTPNLAGGIDDRDWSWTCQLRTRLTKDMSNEDKNDQWHVNWGQDWPKNMSNKDKIGKGQHPPIVLCKQTFSHLMFSIAGSSRTNFEKTERKFEVERCPIFILRIPVYLPSTAIARSDLRPSVWGEIQFHYSCYRVYTMVAK